MRRPIPLIERFSRHYICEPNTGCWIWTASQNGSGYGQINVNGRPIAAHRIAWAIYRGDQGGLHVLHKCDVKLCVNPEHLYLGTAKDNSRDARERGQMATGFRLPHTRLYESQIGEIRKLAATGTGQAEIAKRFGISQPYTSRIIRGERRVS